MHDEYRRIEIAELSRDTQFQCRASRWQVDDLLPSIRRDGQLLPVLVRPAGRKYVLIAGFRRVAALKKLGRKWVQARILHGISDDEARRIALAENLDRHSLTAWDQVAAAWKFRQQGLGNAAIAANFRVSIRTIQRYLRVAEAPANFQRALERDEITIQQAYEALQRGVALAEVIGQGRSVSFLRGLSREPAAQGSVRIQRKTSGEILIRIRYTPRKTRLDRLFQEIRKKLRASGGPRDVSLRTPGR